MANHSTQNTEPPKLNKKFGNLADLTNNHLQKSGNALRTSNFVIPKLSLKSNDAITPISPLNVKLEAKNKIAENVQTLLEDVNQLQISPEIVKYFINDSEENSKDEDNDLENSREFLIDLTTVLRQTSVLSVNEKKNEEQLSKYDLKDIYIMTAEPLPSSMIADSLDTLKKCEINLSQLQFTKLSHASHSVSLFGKMLCRRWRPTKPYVKIPQRSCGQLKTFDFNSPSPDTLILNNLMKK